MHPLKLRYTKKQFKIVLMIFIFSIFVFATFASSIRLLGQRVGSRPKAAESNIGFDNALQLNGSNTAPEYVSVPSNSVLNSLGDSFTIEAWIKPSFPTTPFNKLHTTHLVSKLMKEQEYQEVETTYQFDLTYSYSYSSTTYANYGFSFSVADANSNCSNKSTGYSSGWTKDDFNKWHHVAGVLRNKKLYLFLDGKLISANTQYPVGATGCTSNAPLKIGYDRYLTQNDRSQNNNFQGLIDEVQISNVARYIYDFYPTGPYVPDDNTVALWRFEQNANDVVRSENNGTIYGAVEFVNENLQIPTPTPTQVPASVYDRALDLKNNNYLIVNPRDGTINLGKSFTIEGWYRTGSTFPYFENVVSAIQARAENPTFKLYRSTRFDNTLVFLVTDKDNNLYEVKGYPSYLQPNTWHHFAAVKDNNTLRLFVNGNWSGTYIMTPDPRPLGTFLIGANQYNGSVGDYLTGQLDELRISSIARYTNDFEPPSGPFIRDENTLALYHFNGDTLDDTPNRNDAIAVQTAQFIDSEVPLNWPTKTPTPTPTPSNTPTPTPWPDAVIEASPTKLVATVVKNYSYPITYSPVSLSIINNGSQAASWQLTGNFSGYSQYPGGVIYSVPLSGFGFDTTSGILASHHGTGINFYFQNSKPPGVYTGDYKFYQTINGYPNQLYLIKYEITLTEPVTPTITPTLSPTPTGVPTALPLTANFKASPTQGKSPLTVTFTNKSIEPIPGTTVAMYKWSFGDGAGTTTYALNEKPKHKYKINSNLTSQTFTVKLQATDLATNKTSTKKLKITVTK